MGKTAIVLILLLAGCSSDIVYRRAYLTSNTITEYVVERETGNLIRLVPFGWGGKPKVFWDVEGNERPYVEWKEDQYKIYNMEYHLRKESGA